MAEKDFQLLLSVPGCDHYMAWSCNFEGFDAGRRQIDDILSRHVVGEKTPIGLSFILGLARFFHPADFPYFASILAESELLMGTSTSTSTCMPLSREDLYMLEEDMAVARRSERPTMFNHWLQGTTVDFGRESFQVRADSPRPYQTGRISYELVEGRFREKP